MAIKGELTDTERRRQMRVIVDTEICSLLNDLKRADKYPDVACLESPLAWIKPQFAKGPRKATRGMYKGDAAIEEQDGETGGKGGPNASTVLLLNQMFATADTVLRHKVDTVLEVNIKTWQTIATDCPGDDPKERSIEFCRRLKIEIPAELNKIEQGDAADAAVIAVWCDRHAQELKMRRDLFGEADEPGRRGQESGRLHAVDGGAQGDA